MGKSGVDKRIVKTKNAIHTAFKSLVQEKDMANISICELTERAGVTRSTFYMYYQDVSDVRDDIENEILEKLDKTMSEAELAATVFDPYPLLSTIANEIVKYDRDNRYILSSDNSGKLLDKLGERVVASFMNMFVKSQMNIDLSRAKYVAAFFSAGIFECFKLWYNHQSSLTLEELCQRMCDMVKTGLAIAVVPPENR